MNFSPVSQSSASEAAASTAGGDTSQAAPLATDASFIQHLNDGLQGQALDNADLEAASVDQTLLTPIKLKGATSELDDEILNSDVPDESTDLEALAENPFAFYFVPSNVSYTTTPELSEGVGEPELNVAASTGGSIATEGLASNEVPVASVPAATNGDATITIDSDLGSAVGSPVDIPSEQQSALTLSGAEAVSDDVGKGNEAGLGNKFADTATTKVTEILPAKNVTSPAELRASPGDQVKVALVNHFQSMDGERVKSLSLELHPAELGHLQIRIEQTGDQLFAQIVATEASSTELLLQQRDQLVKALDALGLGDAELNIFHDGQQQQQTNQQRPDSSNQNRTTAAALPAGAESPISDSAANEHAARVNIMA